MIKNTGITAKYFAKILFIFALIINNDYVYSQEITHVKTDDLIRIRVQDNLRKKIYSSVRIKGYYSGSDNTGISFKTEPEKEIRNIPFNHIRKIELLKGKKTHMKMACSIGFITGYISGIVTSSYASSSVNTPLIDSAFDIYVLSMGLIGGFLGIPIGSMIKTDKWEEIPLDTFKGGLRPPDRYYPIFRYQFPLRK
ncbi:hypothetical protein ACFL6O_01430 [candidate division KSB1 bacterium]